MVSEQQQAILEELSQCYGQVAAVRCIIQLMGDVRGEETDCPPRVIQMYSLFQLLDSQLREIGSRIDHCECALEFGGRKE